MHSPLVLPQGLSFAYQAEALVGITQFLLLAFGLAAVLELVAEANHGYAAAVGELVFVIVGIPWHFGPPLNVFGPRDEAHSGRDVPAA